MRILGLSLTVLTMATLAACSDSTGNGSTGGRSTTITVSNNQFMPNPDTMAAGTVTFTWAAGAVTHNVTWLTGPTSPTGSGNRSSGSADYTASVVQGTYTYHCTIHGGMNGTIVVE